MLEVRNSSASSALTYAAPATRAVRAFVKWG